MKDDKDILQKLFWQLPEKPLSDDFRFRMMQQISAERIRAKNRAERWTWFAVITASLAILAFGVLAFSYLEVPKLSLSKQALETLPFYLYVAFLALLLLFGDFFFRRNYYSKKQG
ncbi:MAG: hypothetical protein LBM67_05390 [Lentimicrobiaceae bacterium]|jgi:hypothetical protein|nr:hypothetical protein [Lentimicrobiaceae bacterium]